MVLPSTPKPTPFFPSGSVSLVSPAPAFGESQRRLGWLSFSLSTPDNNPTRVLLPKLRGLRRLGGHWPLGELPQASGPQLICPDRRPCHRRRTQRARVFDLESNASPFLGAVPAPWVSAGAAPSPQDFDGLEQATLRARPPPAIPSPTPGPAPKPKLRPSAAPSRERSSCSQQLGGGGARRPRCGRGQSQASGPPPHQPGADPRPAGEGNREKESCPRHLSSSVCGGRDRTGAEAARSPPPPAPPPRPRPLTRLRVRPRSPPTLPRPSRDISLISKREKSTSKRTPFFARGPPSLFIFWLPRRVSGNRLHIL